MTHSAALGSTTSARSHALTSHCVRGSVQVAVPACQDEASSVQATCSVVGIGIGIVIGCGLWACTPLCCLLRRIVRGCYRLWACSHAHWVTGGHDWQVPQACPAQGFAGASGGSSTLDGGRLTWNALSRHIAGVRNGARGAIQLVGWAIHTRLTAARRRMDRRVRPHHPRCSRLHLASHSRRACTPEPPKTPK